MFTRRHNKSDFSRILQGMDFGKLEQSAIAVIEKGSVIHQVVQDSLVVSSPTGRLSSEIDALDALYLSLQSQIAKATQNSITGAFASAIWGDDLYTPPTSRLTNQVNKIIDNFWENPGIGLEYMYLSQIQRNPKTKDVFKGKSTTHHYPWYRRGTKY